MKKAVRMIAMFLVITMAVTVLPIRAEAAYKYSAPKITHTQNLTGGVKIRWNKSPGAAKYRVFSKTSGGKWTSVGETKGTSFTWTKAKCGKGYYFTVRCISSDGKKYTSGYDKKGVCQAYAAVPTISSTKSGSATTITLKWKKPGQVSGYQIQYSTNKTFQSNTRCVNIKSGNTVSKTLSNLSQNKTYYIRIRSYKSFNGKTCYSAWSKVKNLKTKVSPTSTNTIPANAIKQMYPLIEYTTYYCFENDIKNYAPTCTNRYAFWRTLQFYGGPEISGRGLAIHDKNEKWAPQKYLVNAAYALFPDFKGTLPAVAAGVKYNSSKNAYSILLGDYGDIYFVYGKPKTNSDGSVDIDCSIAFYEGYAPETWQLHLVPNKHVNQSYSESLRYYYTVQKAVAK